MALIDRSVEDPASAVAREDVWETVLSGLGAQHRAAVLLNCRHGLTFTEIGRVFGMTRSGAYQVYAQAIAKLRASGKYRALLN